MTPAIDLTFRRTDEPFVFVEPLGVESKERELQEVRFHANHFGRRHRSEMTLLFLSRRSWLRRR